MARRNSAPYEGALTRVGLYNPELMRRSSPSAQLGGFDPDEYISMGERGNPYSGMGTGTQEILLGGIADRARTDDAVNRFDFTFDRQGQSFGNQYSMQKDIYKQAYEKAQARNKKGLVASWLGTAAGAAASFIPGAGPFVAPLVKAGVSTALS